MVMPDGVMQVADSSWLIAHRRQKIENRRQRSRRLKSSRFDGERETCVKKYDSFGSRVHIDLDKDQPF
jgi:hypothetical protein